MKKCPYCAEEIQDEAVICRFCQRDLRSGNPLPASTKQHVTPAKSSGSGCGTPLFMLGIFIFGATSLMGCANFVEGQESLLGAFIVDPTTIFAYILSIFLIFIGNSMRKNA